VAGKGLTGYRVWKKIWKSGEEEEELGRDRVGENRRGVRGRMAARCRRIVSG